MSDITSTSASSDRLGLALAVVGVLLHLAAGWLVSVSGLLAPLWAIVMLAAVWLAACVPLVRAVRSRARWAPLVPIAVLAIWGATMTFGDLVLGWTA